MAIQAPQACFIAVKRQARHDRTRKYSSICHRRGRRQKPILSYMDKCRHANAMRWVSHATSTSHGARWPRKTSPPSSKDRMEGCVGRPQITPLRTGRFLNMRQSALEVDMMESYGVRRRCAVSTCSHVHTYGRVIEPSPLHHDVVRLPLLARSSLQACAHRDRIALW